MGFESVRRMRAARCADAPQGPGVYVVVRASPTAVRFRALNPGGHFKGRDPSMDPGVLRDRWIDDTPVIYIGKADHLRRRLRSYLDFGAGLPKSHWGGRYVWQIQGSDAFLVAWREDPEPLRREAILLTAFVRQYGALPFANLRR